MKVCVFFKSAQQQKLELPLKYMSNSISNSENSIKVYKYIWIRLCFL